MLPETIRISYCCSYLVKGEDGYLLVDTGNDSKARHILRYLKKNGIAPGEIKLIVLTHAHFDHVYAAAKLKELSGAKIVIQASEAEYLEQGRTPIPEGTNPFSRIIVFLGRLFHSPIMRFPKTNADIIVEEELDLREFGFDYTIIRTPGHTEGSISLISSEKHAIVGDVAFGIAKQCYTPFTNDPETLKKTWKSLLNMGIETFYSGHGKPVPADRMQAWLIKNDRSS